MTNWHFVWFSNILFCRQNCRVVSSTKVMVFDCLYARWVSIWKTAIFLYAAIQKQICQCSKNVWPLVNRMSTRCGWQQTRRCKIKFERCAQCMATNISPLSRVQWCYSVSRWWWSAINFDVHFLIITGAMAKATVRELIIRPIEIDDSYLDDDIEWDGNWVYCFVNI